LLQKLPQEEDGTIHVYGAYKRYELEEKKPGLEREKEGARPKDLCQSL
jgi:hypothetical protein